jgi:hypothetical protein
MLTPQFYSNMNFPAPLSVLGFLAAVGGLALSILAILVTWFVRKPRIARGIAALAGAGAIVYFGLLFGFSLGSRDHTLAHGQEKYFCEIDCHLAYSIVSVSTQAVENATRYSVVLRTRFDETTISPRRPRGAPNYPNPRDVRLVDDSGQTYLLSAVTGTPLSTPIAPGELYTTTLQFDVPPSAAGLRLLITSPESPAALLIGDENSWLHKKTYFAL